MSLPPDDSWLDEPVFDPAMAHALLVAEAHRDSGVFASQCLLDEISGQPVELAPMHWEMHRLWQHNTRTVCWSYPEAGKSQNMAAHIAWRIGNDPSIRVLYLSGTQEQAAPLLRACGIIMRSAAYAEIFPGVQVERQTATELWSLGRSETAKDSTITIGAPGLSSLQGKRADLIVFDDVVTVEAMHSQATRDRDYTDAQAVANARLAPGGVRHEIGVAMHPDDILHRDAKHPGTVSRKFPALDAQGQPTFPARWPSPRVEARARELGPVRAAAVLQCEARAEGTLCFPQADLDRALQNGLVAEANALPQGRCVIGVDPAMTIKGDESGIAMCTIDGAGFRHLVGVEGIRVHHETLVSRVIALAQINKAVVYVESNAGGNILADAIGKKVPCKAVPTSLQSKTSRVEALAIELASGRWHFRQPLGYPTEDLRKLLGEMAVFSMSDHCGDRLAALLIGVEGIRALESRPKGGVLNVHRTDGGRWTFTR